MKKMRRLIPAFAMLLVAATMLSTASFAWFTMGTTATAEGMQVTAQSASTLLIIDAESTAATNNLYNAFVNATNVVNLAAHTKTLVPATAYQGGELGEDDEGEDVVPTSGLVTLADFGKVNSVTGNVTEGATYVEATDNTNYIEYVVYLASGAGEMTSTDGKTLCATVSLPEVNGVRALDKYIDNALSIQFTVYDSTEDDEALVQTITFNQVAAANGVLVVNLGTASIPNAFETDEETGGYAETVNDYVKVVMRVYYDGAKVDDSVDKAYVRNDTQVAVDDATAFNLVFEYKVAQ